MVAQSLPLAHVIHVWDLILAQPPTTLSQHPRLSFLVDVCTSMVLRLRSRLIVTGNRYKGGLWGEEAASDQLALASDGTMGDGFVEGMKILQSYPIDAIGVASIIQGAWWLVNKERRDGVAEDRRRSASAMPTTLARVGVQLRDMAWSAPPIKQEHDDDADAHSDATTKPSRFAFGHLFDSTDAAATLAKARSNWSAAAIDAWSRPSQSHSQPASAWTTIPSRPLQAFAEKTKGIGLKSWASSWGSQPNMEMAREETPSPRMPQDKTAAPNSTPGSSQNSANQESATFSSPSIHNSESSRQAVATSPTTLLARSVQAALINSPSSPPLSPAVIPGRGPRPLILSNHRITRDYSLSRQSSISSLSGRAGEARLSESDTPSSRVVPLRRRKIATDGGSSPSSPIVLSRSPTLSPVPSPNFSLPSRRRPAALDQFKMMPPNFPGRSALPDSPSTLPNSPSPPTPLDGNTWPADITINDGHNNQLDPRSGEGSDTHALASSAGTVRASRLRTKRSLPPLQSLTPEPLASELISDTSEEEGGKGPLTPRPFPGRHSPDPVARRKSSPRGRRVRKLSRGDHTTDTLEPPLMISEEEGAKGDDEDDYNDFINSYSTDDVDSS